MKVSYMYTAFIGFLITFFLGIVLSYIFKKVKKLEPELIYTEEYADLFMPPKARLIRKRNVKALEIERYKNEINEKY